MADTIFTPPDAFARMLAQHRQTGADVTLGIFPTNRPEKLCPVTVDAAGWVLNMVDKPAHSNIMNTWGCACWSPVFTQFMHNYLGKVPPGSKEVVLADVFRGAMATGMNVMGLFFEEGEYIDIGAPDDLVQAVHRFSER